MKYKSQTSTEMCLTNKLPIEKSLNSANFPLQAIEHIVSRDFCLLNSAF
jgi:hypothetical protein